MSTAYTVKDLVDNVAAYGKVVTGTNREAVTAAADVYKDSVLTQGRMDSGGDLRLSRWGRNGLKLNAGYDVDGRGTKAEAIIKPRPMGPWKVLEYGAAKHPIIPGLTRRQQRAMALFSAMAGGRGEFDVAALAGMARGNRNNRGGSRRRNRPMFLAAAGFGDKRKQGAAYVNHPGTQGKKTWSEGVAKGTDGAISAYKRTQIQAMSRISG